MFKPEEKENLLWQQTEARINDSNVIVANH